MRLFCGMRGSRCIKDLTARYSQPFRLGQSGQTASSQVKETNKYRKGSYNSTMALLLFSSASSRICLCTLHSPLPRSSIVCSPALLLLLSTPALLSHRTVLVCLTGFFNYFYTFLKFMFNVYVQRYGYDRPLVLSSPFLLMPSQLIPFLFQRACF